MQVGQPIKANTLMPCLKPMPSHKAGFVFYRVRTRTLPVGSL